MHRSIESDRFLLEYVESNVESHVLRESHCHARFEMICVLEGDVSIMLEGRSYRLQEKQSVIIPPLYYHTITANKHGVYRRVTALFDMTDIPAVLREHYASKSATLTVLRSEVCDELERICHAEDPTFFAPLAESLVIRLLYSDAENKNAETVWESDEFLQKIITYIDRHVTRQIRLEELARHTARSKSSVCHLFEERMGISPGQYILQKRLALASKLIRDGMPPTLAAICVGYENYSNFYRVYKKHLHVSPAKDGR